MSSDRVVTTSNDDLKKGTLVSDPKVTLRFCVITTVIVVAGLFYYFSELEHARKEKSSELIAIGKMKVEQIVRWRRERIADADGIANSPAVKQLVTAWLRDPERLINKKELIERLGLEVEHGIYSQALLVGADQKILLSGASQPAALETDTWAAVKKSLTQPGPVLCELHRTSSGKIHIDIVMAIRDSSGQVLAILVLTTDAEEFLFPMIQFWPTSSPSGETLLVRREGDEVIFLNELRHQKKTALELHLPLSQTALPATQAVLGKTGIFYGKDYHGIPVMADLRPVPGTDWFVVAKESTSEIEGEIRLRAVTVTGVVLMLILCVAGGMALWNQTLQVGERRRTEALLRDSETRYRRLFETAKDGIIILDAVTGKIVDVNPFLIEMLGYSRDQFLEKKIWEVGFLKDVIANKDNFLKLQQEKFVRYEDLPLEAADGRRIDVEFVSNVYRVDHHDVIQCNIRDITDRKRADEAARRSSKEWKDTFDAMSDAVWLLSSDSRILRCNKATRSVLNLNPEEIVGKYCYEAVHGMERPYPDCPIVRMRTSGQRESMELLLGERWFLVTVDPVFDLSGSLAGIVHVVSDITERKQASEMLIKLTGAKSKFTATVSHELRSPLAVVKEALDILSEGMVGSVNREQKEVLGMAKGNIDRLSRLINNVLDFQKIESGKMFFDIQENDLNETLTEVFSNMNILSKNKGLDLKLKLDEGLPKVRFDRDKIVQVLTNLMSNATNNTPKGSVILTSKKENNIVQISVKDAGIGISAEDLEKLFQPFEQADASKAKKKGGTGLGLAISKEIILAHQGKIWAESEVGKGSAFHFTLPL